MKLATRELIRKIDSRSIRNYKIPGLVLMENAGRAAADVICREFHYAKSFSVICGNGNNGGDGFVIARQLISRGKEVKTYITGRKKDYKGDAKTNLESLLKISERVFELKEKLPIEDTTEIYIDSIFGTGLDREVKGFYKKIIQFLNNTGKPTISVDIPSGLDCNTGRPLGISVEADTTITFITPKLGMCIYPGINYAGNLYIANITTYKELEKDIKYELLSFTYCKNLLKERKSDSHKGNNGHLLVFAGSKGKSGAAALAANAAKRTGAGLVTLGVPKCIGNVIESKTTEAMSLELEDTNDGSFSSVAAKLAFDNLKNRKNALAIGPGISTNEETKKFFLSIIQRADVPTVIDADGINILAENLKVLKKLKNTFILTPHPGEMARLCNLSTKEVQENRVEISKNFAMEFRCYVVLKGARSVIADPEGMVFINPTGNPGMASGGMGDVLTGMIGALLAQGYSPIEASTLGTFLHGFAGDLAAEKFGQLGIVASDLIEKIPESFNRLESQNEIYFHLA